MELIAIGLGTVAFLEAIVIFLLAREMRQRDVSVEYIADLAADISAKTHVSYDTAMQSLVGIMNLHGERLKK